MSEIELPMSMEEIKGFFEERLEDSIIEYKTQEFEKGLKKNKIKFVWITIEKDVLRDAVKAISEIQVPHLSVTSGSDIGDEVELNYHFAINFSYPGEETTVTFKVRLPKDDLTIPTITDLVPGAITTEREKQEFLGVDVIDIPDDRRLWLDENYPEDKYPWRWDETGMEEQSHYPHDPDEAPVTPTAKNTREGGESDE